MAVQKKMFVTSHDAVDSRGRWWWGGGVLSEEGRCHRAYFTQTIHHWLNGWRVRPTLLWFLFKAFSSFQNALQYFSFFFFFLPLPPTADVDVDGVGGFTRTCASAVRVFYKKWEKGVNFSLPPHCILCAINHEKKKKKKEPSESS